MRRRLFTLCSACSLLLCAAVCGLWVRSYWLGDQVHFRGRSVNLEAANSRGTLRLKVSDVRVLPAEWRKWGSWYPYGDEPHGWERKTFPAPTAPGFAEYLHEKWDVYEVLGERVRWRKYGFTYIYGAPPPPDTPLVKVSYAFPTWEILLPAWFVVLGSSVLPMWWSRAAYRSRRRGKAGHCPACGYDCRATPARCPECGRRAAA